MERELKMPRVSVVLPVRNGMAHLPLAVESILGQTFRDFEFIIVDDASTDDTAAYLDGLLDARVRVIRNEQSVGVARSLNKAIATARGEYIARQDADDVSLPERLEAQASYLDCHPQIAVLGSPATIINGDGDAIGAWHVPFADIDIQWRLLFDNCIIHPSVMIRGSVLRACGGYPEEAEFSLAEDYELWFRIGRGHGFANLQQRLINFRIHRGSVSNRDRDRQRQQVRRIVLANVACMMDGCSVREQDYESVGLLLFSPPSFKPHLSAAALWSAVRFLRKLQYGFYARHRFASRAAMAHRTRLQWTWGKHLVALAIRARFDFRTRITAALLGVRLLWDSFAACLHWLVTRQPQPAASGELLATVSSNATTSDAHKAPC